MRGQGQFKDVPYSAKIMAGNYLLCWRQLRAPFELHVAQCTAQVQRAIHAPVMHKTTRLRGTAGFVTAKRLQVIYCVAALS